MDSEFEYILLFSLLYSPYTQKNKNNNNILIINTKLLNIIVLYI